MYQIHDDHAYFYDVSSFAGPLGGIQNYRIKNNLPYLEKDRLLYRQEDDDDVKNYTDMYEYNETDLLEAIDGKKLKVFYVQGQDLAELAKRLTEMKISFYPSYEDTAMLPIQQRIKSLSIIGNKGKRKNQNS